MVSYVLASIQREGGGERVGGTKKVKIDGGPTLSFVKQVSQKKN